jgi:hypothetical protein
MITRIRSGEPTSSGVSSACLTSGVLGRRGPEAQCRRTKAALASAAAWSPNPKNPPFFFDLPSKEGQVQPAIAAKWAANASLAMIDQHIPNLKDGDSTSNLMTAEVRDL